MGGGEGFSEPVGGRSRVTELPCSCSDVFMMMIIYQINFFVTSGERCHQVTDYLHAGETPGVYYSALGGEQGIIEYFN